MKTTTARLLIARFRLSSTIVHRNGQHPKDWEDCDKFACAQDRQILADAEAEEKKEKREKEHAK